MKKGYSSLHLLSAKVINRCCFAAILLFLTVFANNAQGQIYGPDGLNMPGTWSGTQWSDPPSPTGSGDFNGIETTGGQLLVQTALPTRRYATTINVQSSGGDCAAGTYAWLFTSGNNTNSYFNNKWGNVTVSNNTIQTYSIGSGAANNSVTLSNGNYYTVVWQDAGYNNTSANWMPTASAPVSINSTAPPISPATAVSPGEILTLTATLGSSTVTGQSFYIRYANNSSYTGSTVVAVTPSGNSLSYTMPAAVAGTTIYYYFFSSSVSTLVSNPPSNIDLFTIQYSNPGNNYTVTAGWTTAAIGNWSTAGTWTANAVPPTSADMGTVNILHTVAEDQNATTDVLNVNIGTATKTLTINSGVTLTTNSNSTSASTITGSNSVVFAGGTSNWNAGNATLTNNGIINMNAGGNLTFAGGGSTVLSNSGAGSFTQTGGTVTFNGAATVSGTAATFNNLTVTTGTVNLGTTPTVNGTLTLTGGSVLVSGTTLTLAGPVSSPASSPGTISASGTANVTINGSGAVTNPITFAASTSLNNLVDNRSGVVVAITSSNTITLGGSSSVGSGATLATGTTLANNGTFSVAATGTFQINQGGYASGTAFTYTSGGTLVYNYTQSGTYGPVTSSHAYFPSSNGPTNLTLMGTGTGSLQLGESLAITGTLDIENSAEGLDLQTYGFSAGALNIGATTINPSLTLKGSSALTVTGAVNINSGTLTLSSTSGGNLNVGGNFTNNGAFTPSGETVTFNGTSQAIAGSTNTGFYNLTINGGSDVVTINTPISASNNLTLTAGTLQFGVANAIGSTGNIIFGGGTLSTGASTGYSATTGATMQITANSHLNLGTGFPQVLKFTTASATAWTAGQTLTVNGWNGTAGNSNSGNGPQIIFNSSSALSAGSSGQCGQIAFTGNAGTPLLLAGGELVPPCGSTSTLTNTISIQSGSNPECSGSSITFSSSVVNGGTPQYQWYNGASPIGGATSATYTTTTLANTNAISLSVTSTANCVSPVSLASNTITMTVNPAGTWIGATSNDWNTAGNWCGNAVPTSSTAVVIPTGASPMPVISSTGNGTCASITIQTGASLTMQNSSTLTVAGAFANSGTFTAGSSTGVIFSGTGTITGTVVFNNLTLNGALTNPTTVTVNGILQLATNNSTLSNVINYGSSSTLQYYCNGTIPRGNEWNNTTGSGAGYPNDVEVSNNTILNFANGITTTTAQMMARDLTVDNGSALYMDYGNYSVPLTVGRDVLLNGNLSLGYSNGGDIIVGRNWTRNSSTSALNLHSRAVFFDGTGVQVLNTTGGETFNYMIVEGSGYLQLASALTVNASSGLTLNSSNTSYTIDLDGQTMTLSGGGSINLSSGNRIIGSSTTGGAFAISGATSTSFAGTLLFGDNVAVQLTNSMDFGSGVTTIGQGNSGSLQLNSSSASVSNNPPKYATNSTLIYNTGGNIAVGTEWTGGATTGAGVPYNVTVGTGVGSGMNFGSSASTYQCKGSFLIGGNNSVNLSTNAGNLAVAGNFTNNNNLTPHNSTVTMNGGTAQIISGSATPTFYNLSIANTSGGVSISKATTEGGNLTLTTGTLTFGVANAVAVTGNTIFAGGTLTTGGYSASMGGMGMTSSSSINLTNSTPQTLTFGNASGTWSGTLTINNWVGNPGLTGGSTAGGKIIVGTLSSGQQSDVTFTSYASTGSVITASNELVPKCAPSNYPVVSAGGNQSICSGAAYTFPGGNATASGYNTLAWSTSGTGTFANGTTLTPTYTASSADLAAGSVTLTLTGTNDCGGTPSNMTLTFTANNWTGNSGTDWNVAGNWCGGVPTSGSNVVIPTGLSNYPVIGASSGTPVCNNITIASGGSAKLTFSNAFPSNNTLTVSGNLTNGGTIDMTSGGTIAFASGNTFTNNGTFTAGTGTVLFEGTANSTLNGTSTTTFNTLTIDFGVGIGLTIPTSGTIPVIAGTLIMEGGHLVSAPIYGASSTLQYNGSYNRFIEWSATAAGTIGTTPGYPNNVTVNTGTLTLYNSTQTGGGAMAGTLNINTGTTMDFTGYTSSFTVGGDVDVNGSGSLYMSNMSGAVTVDGNLNIAGNASGSTIATVNLSSMSANFTVKGSVSNSGSLTLSSTPNYDLYVGGNWIFTQNTGSTAVFAPSQRAVFFNGASMQTITRQPSSGTLNFDYVVVQNTNGGIQLASSPATSININAPLGSNGLVLSGTGTGQVFDLNGNTCNLTVSQAIETTVAGETITSSTGTGTFNIESGTISSVIGTGTLSFSSSVTVTLEGGMNFGNQVSNVSLSTINGTLQINGGGYVSTYAPNYANNSLLEYNSGSTGVFYGRGTEWGASSGQGYPYNVEISNNTILSPGGNSLTNNTGTVLSMAGNLTIDAGSSFYMDYSTYSMTVPLNVAGNILINGNLSESLSVGGDINIKGNWTNNGTFANQSRTVTFNGSLGQTIGGTRATGFGYLTINTGSGAVVTVNTAATVANILTLTTGVLNTLTASITISNTSSSGCSGGSASSFVNGPLNWMLPVNLTSSSSVYSFPIGAGSTYLPLSVTSVTTGNNQATIAAQAFTGNCLGTAGTGLASISNTEYWNITTVSGNYGGGSVSLTRQSSVTASSVIGSSASSNGTYTFYGGTANTSTNSINNSNVVGAAYYVMSVPVAAPSISSVIPTTPAITGQLNNTGYTGQTLTINGSNFPSNATVTIGGLAATSVNYINSSQLTAVVGQSASGNTVIVTNPSTGGNSSASFTYLGYITNANSDWNTGSTWLGGLVPPTAATTTVNNNITCFNPTTYSPATVTVNSGSKITFGTSGNLNISSALTFAGTIDMTSGGTIDFNGNCNFINNGTFIYGLGTVNFAGNNGTSTVGGSNGTSFYDVEISGPTSGINMGGSPTPNSTIIHSFTIGTGSYFVTNAPNYATNSTLIYNVNGSYNRNVEWSQTSGPAYPYNVEVMSGTTLNISFGTGLSDNTARAIAGTLTIDNGASVTMNAMTATMTTGGLALNTGGTLTLSSAVGGDYIIDGNWSNSGTFNPSSRAVQFSGSSAQTITGATTFDYLTIDNSAGVSLNSSINIENTLTFTTGNLVLGAYNATLVSGQVIAGAGANGYVQTNSTGQFFETVGNSAVYFTVGNAEYNPIILTNTGTSSVYGIKAIDGSYSTPNNNTKVVNERWQITGGTTNANNLAVKLQWNTGQEAANFLSGTHDYIGFYDGSAWTENGATQSGSNPYTFTSIANFTPSNLTTGTQYFALGKDNAFLCPASITAPVITGTNVACYGNSTGTITVSTLPTGGLSPYTYSLNGGTYQSSTSFTGLPAANYSVVAMDGNGCTSAGSNAVSVTQPSAALSVSASNTGPYTVGQTISLSSSVSGGTTNYSYSWSGPSFSNSTANPTITNATTGMSGTYTITVTDANSCTATSSTGVTVAAISGYTWTGTTSVDWAVTTNWNPVAPVGGPNSISANVYIPSVNNKPVISSAVSVGNLIIDENAQITLNQNLNVYGNWTGSGGADAVINGAGILVFSGTSAQTISGNTSVQEVEIANSAGVSLQTSSALDVYTALDLQSGAFNVSNGTITFKSTATTGTAIIDNFTTGRIGTLIGNVKAEQYYVTPAANSYSQHYMGTPVNSMSLSQFGASGTTGFVTPLSDCDETVLAMGSDYGKVFSFNESHGASCELGQWEVMGGGTAQNGLGYSVVLSGTGTITVSGAPNLSTSNSITISGLTNSAYPATTSHQGRQYQPGWQMLANPYLATIVIDPTVNQSNFDNQLWVWDAVSGSYIQPANNAIAPFQAFWVHKTNGGSSSTFTINPNERTRSVSGTFYSLNADQLTLVTQNTTTGMLDQITVGFNANATDTFDARYDANKMAGLLNRQTMYSVISTGTRMATNILHDEATTSTVPVGFEPGNTATYTLSFNGVNSFDPTSYIYLEDNFLNIMYNARNGDYTFSSDSADRWDRFVLHFTPPAVISTSAASCDAAGVIDIQQPGTAYWNYVLTDSNSAIVASGTLNQNQPVSAQVAAGTYTLTLTDTNGYVAVKSIQVNGVPMIAASFQASKDTLPVQQYVVLTATTPDAVSYLWNLGNGQTATGTNAIASYTQAGTYTVSLLVTNQAGCSSTQTQTITVTQANTTGLSSINGNGNVNIWSHNDEVYVDFTALFKVDATVIIYDILGQEISNEKVTNNLVYKREVSNIDAAYLIVMVKNEDKITTKKVFITNSK